MSPKIDPKAKGVAKGAAKPTIADRRAEKKGVAPEKPKKVDPLPPMNPTDLKEMVGWMKYHGMEKKIPCTDAAKALEKFHESSPEEKRKILASFKSPSGKSLKWAKEVVTAETVSDKWDDVAQSGMMTRPVGNKYVRSSSFREGGSHRNKKPKKL